MNAKLTIMGILVIFPLLLTQQNCTKLPNAKIEVSGSLQDAAQPPTVQCVIQDSSGKALRTFGNSSAADSSLQPIVSGSNVRVNCSLSAGDVSLADQFTYHMLDGAGVRLKSSNGSLSSPADNGHILFTKMQANEPVLHVSCSPEGKNTSGVTAFGVTGTNVYDGRSGGIPQSLSINFSNLRNF